MRVLRRETEIGQNRCPKRTTEKRQQQKRPALLCPYPCSGGCCRGPHGALGYQLLCAWCWPRPRESVQWAHGVGHQSYWSKSSPRRELGDKCHRSSPLQRLLRIVSHTLSEHSWHNWAPVSHHTITPINSFLQLSSLSHLIVLTTHSLNTAFWGHHPRKPVTHKSLSKGKPKIKI